MAEIKQEEKTLASWGLQKFKDAMLAKEPYTSRWMTYLNAWNNSLYEDATTASYKSNQISNFVFSTIESMRPIMFDGDPKFECLPMSSDAANYVGEINQLMQYEWYRTGMTKKQIANSIYTLVAGSSMFMLQYDMADQKQVDGNVKPVPVNIFNFFPSPLATNMDDGEYYIYADYFHENILKRDYPEKEEFIKGGSIMYPELVNNRDAGSKINNQVLVLEIYARDYTTIEAEQVEGTKVKKSAYPLGRKMIIAPELGIVFLDEPYQMNSGRFPFFLTKDMDIPFQFWGEGEVRYLISPQQYINDLSNQIIDNARNTANMQWIIDKNSGIPQGTLTNRPGLVIRKNPGSEVTRPSPPSMPMYVSEKINSLKSDIEVISGVHDVTRGERPAGIESGSAIQSLQEAAQTRLRLKIKIMEADLGELGDEWLNYIKQFWKFNRLIPQKSATPTADGQPTYNFLEMIADKQLSQPFQVKIVGSSTMQINQSSMLELMIRLGQTIMPEDQMAVVDRAAILDFIPKVNKDAILARAQAKALQQEQLQQQQMQSQQDGEQQKQILTGLTTQMQGMNKDLGGVQDRFAQQDADTEKAGIEQTGYTKGLQEGVAAGQVGQGGPPPEMIDQLSTMSDTELSAALEQYPELANMLQ